MRKLLTIAAFAGLLAGGTGCGDDTASGGAQPKLNDPNKAGRPQPMGAQAPAQQSASPVNTKN